MERPTDQEIAEAAFGLGTFMGTLWKLRKFDADRASDLYQRMLRHVPPDEMITFARWLKDQPSQEAQDGPAGS